MPGPATPPNQACCRLPWQDAEPGYVLWVGARLLPTFGTRSIGVDPHSVPTAVIPLVMLVGVAFGAYWIVGYLLHRVVLVDVVEPVGTNGHLVTSPGQHVLVVCAQPSALAEELKKGDVALTADAGCGGTELLERVAASATCHQQSRSSPATRHPGYRRSDPTIWR